MLRLYQLRCITKETKTQVAEAIGITRQAYANYEIGTRKPPLPTLEKLALHFGVTVDDLLVSQKPRTAVFGEPPATLNIVEEIVTLLNQLPPKRQIHYYKILVDDIEYLKEKKAL